MTKLKSIREHNDAVLERYEVKTGTGVACPHCGSELHESQAGVRLLSSPPQIRVKCFTCNYATTIFA